MSFYFDLILIENLLMNYIIMFTTGIVLKIKIKNYKLIISSLIGSLYALIEYFKFENITENIFMKIVLSFCMVWIAYKRKNIKQFLKQLIMFYGISFIFGGCAFALIYFISPKNVIIKNGVLVGLYPIKITIFAGVVAFLIIQIIFRINKSKLTTKDMICKIEIIIDNMIIKTKALIDSGNMLKDPISNYPVIVVNKSVFKSKNEITELLNSFKGGEINNKYENRIRIIPFTSLGRKNGMIIGIKADGIKIIYEDRTIFKNNIVVGISEQEIGINNKYNALIGLKLLEGSEENEFNTFTKV